jgi:hypothetical protein
MTKHILNGVNLFFSKEFLLTGNGQHLRIGPQKNFVNASKTNSSKSTKIHFSSSSSLEFYKLLLLSDI